jgi:hypothetical protein
MADAVELARSLLLNNTTRRLLDSLEGKLCYKRADPSIPPRDSSRVTRTGRRLQLLEPSEGDDNSPLTKSSLADSVLVEAWRESAMAMGRSEAI